jgi:hypothetical protein
VSLIELLPKVVSEGRREANRILESISDATRISLQTNELVIPSQDSNYRDLFEQFSRSAARAATLTDEVWKNRLIYGDNLLTMQALLAGDRATGLPRISRIVFWKAAYLPSLTETQKNGRYKCHMEEYG